MTLTPEPILPVEQGDRDARIVEAFQQISRGAIRGYVQPFIARAAYVGIRECVMVPLIDVVTAIETALEDTRLAAQSSPAREAVTQTMVNAADAYWREKATHNGELLFSLPGTFFWWELMGRALSANDTQPRDERDGEAIVAAAIRVERDKDVDGLGDDYPDVLVVSAPPPARHHSIMHPLFHIIGHGSGPEDQGFLTSKGRYVSREEGLQIALASGQPMIDHPSRHSTQLFSEDLW